MSDKKSVSKTIAKKTIFKIAKKLRRLLNMQFNHPDFWDPQIICKTTAFSL